MPQKKKRFRINNVNYNVGVISQEVSLTLDVFRIDFFKNIEYLRRYTGLKQQSFYKEMRRHGVSNTRLAFKNIQEQKIFGFDLYLVAAAAHVFNLPVKLLLNMDIEAKGIDLTEYGLQPMCFRAKKYTYDGIKYGMEQVESNAFAMQKKIKKIVKGERSKAVERANDPQPIYNFWQHFDKVSS